MAYSFDRNSDYSRFNQAGFGGNNSAGNGFPNRNGSFGAPSPRSGNGSPCSHDPRFGNGSPYPPDPRFGNSNPYPPDPRFVNGNPNRFDPQFGNNGGFNGRSGPMDNGGGRRCPNCRNSTIRCNNNGINAAARAAATEAIVRNDLRRAQEAMQQTRTGRAAPCMSTVSQELYGGNRSTSPIMTSCCDPLDGCQERNIANRDTFWPTFAHPRWLSCDQLYSRNR